MPKTYTPSCSACQLVRFDKSVCPTCPYRPQDRNISQEEIVRAVNGASPYADDLPSEIEQFLLRTARKQFKVVRMSQLKEMAGYQERIYLAAVKACVDLHIEIRNV